MSRSRIVSGLRAAFSVALTASGETILLDEDKALFLSELKGSLVFVPLHPSYWPRVEEFLKAMDEGQEVTAPVGGLYVIEPVTVRDYQGFNFTLARGPYLLRWAKDKVLIVDQEGNVRGAVPYELKFPNRLREPVVNVDQAGESTVFRVDAPWIWSTPATDGGNAFMHPDMLLDDRHAIAGFAVGVILVVIFVLL
ncbi:MAG: hypothetical protein QXK30_02760 [Candidatus Bathyarchaeia archaeon]